jgi:hypothetical protein
MRIPVFISAPGVPVTPLDPALADDGVAAVLGVMYGEPEWGSLLVALGKFSGTVPDSGEDEDEDDLWLVDEALSPWRR